MSMEEELQRLKAAMPDGYTVDRRGRGRTARALLVPVGLGAITPVDWITAIRKKGIQQHILGRRVDADVRVQHASRHFDVSDGMLSKKQWRVVDECRSAECAALVKQWRSERMSEYEGKSTVGATPEVEAAQAAANEAEAAESETAAQSQAQAAAEAAAAEAKEKEEAEAAAAQAAAEAEAAAKQAEEAGKDAPAAGSETPCAGGTESAAAPAESGEAAAAVEGGSPAAEAAPAEPAAEG